MNEEPMYRKPLSAVSLFAIIGLPVLTGAMAGEVLRGARNARSLNPQSVAQLQVLLGMLRGMQWMHHNTHWRASGPNAYGDHLLFQRLYEAGGDPDIAKEIDGLGEKLVAYAGDDAVDDAVIAGHAMRFIDQVKKGAGSKISAALNAELDVRRQISRTYDELKSSGDLSLGFDDFLMALSNERDTAVYLLQQRAKDA